MIGYTTVGTNDLQKAIKFFDEFFAVIGVKSFQIGESMQMWSKGRGSPMLAVCNPYNKEPASVGNGNMVALNVDNKENVQAMHAKALELGAKNEGDPGDRAPGSGFYGAYFRDLDGNKYAVYYLASS